MKRFCLTLVLPIFIGAPLVAQDAAEVEVEPQEPPFIQDGLEADLDTLLWVNRPIVVFADSDADPRFVKQIELLNERPEALLDRDVVVLTDTDPDAKSALRTKLRPRGFMMVLIAKDGTVYLRKPLPWNTREITRSIDKLPARQQEVRDRRAAAQPVTQ